NDVAENNSQKQFNRIRFSKGPIYFSVERKAAYANLKFIAYPDMPDDVENDLPIPKGKNRETDKYYSIQNDFPAFYYLGMEGIPSSETLLRKAQRLQSKAYLIFFDQLLADYLTQLNQLKYAFSWAEGSG